MPWCPKCETEYREGFLNCSDCDSLLVDEIPVTCNDKSVNEAEEAAYLDTYSDDAAYLGNYSDGAEINLVESLLNAHGIPVLKKHRETGGYFKITAAMSVFGVDFYVPSRLLPAAEELLRQAKIESISNVEEEPYENLVERKLKARRLYGWIILLLFIPGVIWLLFGVLLNLYYILFR